MAPPRLPKGDVVDRIFENEIATYRRNVANHRDARKLLEDRAREEKLLKDLLRKKPSPQCEALMRRAYKAEDAGHLAEAVDAYSRVLTLPDEADNHELRAYIGDLMGRLNKQQVAAKLAARQAAREAEAASLGQARIKAVVQGGVPQVPGLGPQAGQLPARPRTAGPIPAGWRNPHSEEAGVPRIGKPVGPMMPMHAEAYRAELAAQAQADRQRRAAAARQEELLGLKQLAVAAAMEALDQHQRHVVGGNDQLAFDNDTQRERRLRAEDRERRLYLEWDELKAAAENPPSGPLAGVDEYARRRAQVQQAHAHRALARNAQEPPQDPRLLYHAAHGHHPRVAAEQAELAAAAAARNGIAAGGPHQPQYYYMPGGGAVAAGLRQRPMSAGAATAAFARERERQRNNDAAMARQYVPGHPYAAVQGPPPAQAWPAEWEGGVMAPPGAVRAAAVAGADIFAKGKKAGPAPFGRPGVDRPTVPIDPKVVRAKQQKWQEKRTKARPLTPQPVVPLRVRRAAGRSPSPPRIAEGALGPAGGGRGAGAGVEGYGAYGGYGDYGAGGY
ncbi:hypothetical protein HYH03_010828 [Edaphochlamys debaryana]|uniref:Uncharacterized protein n=1 Tax=Edaphochlamys debaryana TaxID=47281 RepID=A0A836BVZ2_9CHLO|nr:hypothetical protein HYH03_010828 [Edaphochlamys debaryana]|eukprot:KAG2490915.1 hypothetical protein HYH03_010828 [Edaphochlamys debaryana]